MSKFLEWKKMSEQLKALKAAEMKARKELAAEILFGMAPPCKKRTEMDGIDVQFEIGVSHSIDKAAFESVYDELDPLDKTAIKHEPKLKLREYKAIPKNSLLHEAVVVKPSAPVIKIF